MYAAQLYILYCTAVSLHDYILHYCTAFYVAYTVHYPTVYSTVVYPYRYLCVLNGAYCTAAYCTTAV